MGPVLKETFSMSEEYSVQKLRPSFIFNPLADRNEDVLESLHQETGLDKQVIRTTFSKLRKRMNLNKFRKLNDNETLHEDIGDKVKESGISPLAYDGKIEEGGKKMSTSTFSDAEQLLKESKPVNISFSPVVKIKSEPQQENFKLIKVEPRVKQEALSVEEKARQYDQLKAEFQGLQKQMEELKARLQPGPVQLQTFHQPQYPPWQQPPPSYHHHHHMFPPPPNVLFPPAPYMMTYPPYQEAGGFQAQYFPVSAPPQQQQQPPPPVILPARHIKQEPVVMKPLRQRN